MQDKVYIYAAIIALFCAMIFVRWVNAAKFASPALLVLYRWLRCAFFSLAFGSVVKGSFLPEHNLALLSLCGLMVYFLMETLLYWLQISALNYSDYAMFAPYMEVETAWSAQKKHIDLKKKLEALGFKKTAALKSSPAEGAEVMLTVFDSADGKTRLSVAFLPMPGATFIASAAISIGENGLVYYTEGNPTPFGLAYPENYAPQRHPTVSNPLKILKLHEARIAAADTEFATIKTPPASFMNESLKAVQRASIESGLLNAPRDIEECGIFTGDGKYGVWKDIIAVNYFPFSVS